MSVHPAKAQGEAASERRREAERILALAREPKPAFEIVERQLAVLALRTQVMLSLFTDFENFSTFKPAALHEQNLKTLLDQLLMWGRAMRTVRRETRTAAA